MIPLKEAIQEKHKIAEGMPFNIRMIKGVLSKHEYLLYLNQQREIFKAMEDRGLPHESLFRVPYIIEDIEELVSQGFSTNTVLRSTLTYVNYLLALPYEQVLAHIYLNYMAVMFGGQVIKKAVPSLGKMYLFENAEDSIQAIRKVQKDEWADEVNKGFDYIINIFNELEMESGKMD